MALRLTLLGHYDAFHVYGDDQGGIKCYLEALDAPTKSPLVTVDDDIYVPTPDLFGDGRGTITSRRILLKRYAITPKGESRPRFWFCGRHDWEMGWIVKADMFGPISVDWREP